MNDIPPSTNKKTGPDRHAIRSPEPILHAPRDLQLWFGWLLPPLVAVTVYWVGFGNFFSFDDFIWLSRARTFGQEWLRIFHPDVAYFDPLVHLLFRLDYLVAGLEPRWYHGVDLAIHALNSVLVYRFALRLDGDERSAVYAGVLFASSFAIADAVLWTSSRVDLLSTLCSLGTLGYFLEHLRCGGKKGLFRSILLFVLALGCKGTPLVLPLLLLWLAVLEKKSLPQTLRRVAPFAAIAVVYLLLLKLSMHKASLPLDRVHFNTRNVVLAFCTLFVPEGAVNYLDISRCAPLLFALVTASALAGREGAALRRTGYVILSAGILPVLIVTDFQLVTASSDPYFLLVSPSHRIYFASVGVALLAGGLLRAAESLLLRFVPKIPVLAIATFLTGLVAGNALVVRERNRLWEGVGNRFRAGFDGLRPYRRQVTEGSRVGLIYFPGSAGFLSPMLKLCFGLDHVTGVKKVPLAMTRDREVLGKAEKSFLFILDREGRVHDKTDKYRRQLLLNRMALENPGRPEYLLQAREAAESLRREIPYSTSAPPGASRALRPGDQGKGEKQ